MIGDKCVPIYVKRESHQYGGSFKMRGVGYTVYTAFEEIRDMIPTLTTPSTPFFLVTQSTGNHGIAVLAATIKCLQYFPGMDFVEPVVFASKNIQPEKLDKMNHLLCAYRILVGRPSAGKVLVEYDNYKDALRAREEFLETHRGKYMSHGGKDIMAGHASIGYEIHDQLLAKGIDASSKVTFYAAFGAGGPIGIGHSLQSVRPPTDLVAVQVAGLDAFVRSLISNNVSDNSLCDLDETTTTIAEGIAVNCPENDALELARKILTAAVASNGCEFEETFGLARMSNVVYNVAKHSFVADDTDVIVVLDCESRV
jgi:threonine dehydratase